MTELHNNTTNNTYSSSYDWFDRSIHTNSTYPTSVVSTAHLPPIHFNNNQMNSSDNILSYHNSANIEQDPSTRRSSTYTTTSSTPSPWNTATNTGYSPKDSCELSYDGEDYHRTHGQPTPSPSASTERSRSKKLRTPSTKDIHVERNTEGKPPYSYATLIKYAIENSQRKKLTLSEIYQWVIDHYPYYGSAGTGWKNSIRHNLSLNKSFVRVARPINEPGKGSYWQVDYRAAEAEQRSKTSMAVRGRSNRSGSDPANNPYRPDGSWSSPMSSFSNSQRFNRDSRSLSLDSNTNIKAFPHQQIATSTSSSLAYHQGYYNNHSYGYNTRHGLSNNNRQSGDFSRNSNSSSHNNYLPTAAPSYDMYTANASVDMHHPPQHYQNNHHHHPHQHQQHHQHYQHHQHQQQNGHHRIPQHISSIYDHGTSPYSSIYSPTGGSNGGGGSSGSGTGPSTPHVQGFSSNYQQPKTTIEPTTLSMTNDEQQEPNEQEQSFSTPQPHFKKQNSPTLTPAEAAAVGESPSPPQPTMNTIKGRPNQKVRAALVDNNQYDWIA